MSTHSRAGFLRASAVAIGGAVATAMPVPTARAATAAGDVAGRDGLALLLTLERLQIALCEQALEASVVSGPVAAELGRIVVHEREHEGMLLEVLGADAPPTAPVGLGRATADASRVVRTAVALEDLAVAAYAGQARRVHDSGLRSVLFGIQAVEARHATTLRLLVDQDPVPAVLDSARSRASVGRLIDGTGFVAREG